MSATDSSGRGRSQRGRGKLIDRFLLRRNRKLGSGSFGELVSFLLRSPELIGLLSRRHGICWSREQDWSAGSNQD